MSALSRVMFLSLAVCLAVPTGTMPQDVTLGDTKGANFDVNSVGVGTATDFDNMLGSWNIRFQSKNNGKDLDRPRSGTWTFRQSYDGYLVEDEFSLISPTSGKRSLTLTYRVFNPEKHVWQIVGIDRGSDVWQPGTAWRDGSDVLLVQHDPTSNAILRIRYFNISQSHFLWRADASTDGGKTWLLDILRIEATRQ